jgi:hypothetical protein
MSSYGWYCPEEDEMQTIRKWHPARLVICLVILASVCPASTITINLNPALLTGLAGTVLTFTGTLDNTSSSTVFLNGAGINLAGFGPTNEDTSLFFANAPLSLAGGASTSTIGLFTIGVPGLFGDGSYQGTFTVLGGANPDALVNLGSANFTVQVVPEPNYVLLVSVTFLTLFSYRASASRLTARCITRVKVLMRTVRMRPAWFLLTMCACITAILTDTALRAVTAASLVVTQSVAFTGHGHPHPSLRHGP